MTPEAIAAYEMLRGDSTLMEMYTHLHDPEAVASHDDTRCGLEVDAASEDPFFQGLLWKVYTTGSMWTQYRIKTGDYFRFCWMAENAGCGAPCCTPLDNP